MKNTRIFEKLLEVDIKERANLRVFFYFDLQTRKVVLALGDYIPNCKCHACIGGTNVREDMRKLEEGAQIVVGTPGRVYDMIVRKSLSKYFQKIKT